MNEDIVFSPYDNPNMISIFQLPDGSWKGITQRYGNVVTVREVKPEDCLTKLLTHDGS